MDIKEYVQKNYEGVIDLIKALCGLPAPSHHEELRAEFCKKWLEGIGAKGVYIDEALNVIFPINCEGKKEITVFTAHTDTVFPDTTPYPYVDDGEKIFCPGVGDDTASLAVLLFGAKYILENGLVPENGLLIVCNSCEEGLGNLKGTRQLFKDFAGRIKQFVAFDARIEAVYDRCVGSARYKVTAKTVGGHSYHAFGNPNAIHALSQVVNKIYEIKVPEGGKTTYNVGTVSGGTSVNTIAQHAEMLCECRSDQVTHLEMMKEKLESIFRSVKGEGLMVEVETVGERPCAKGVDENSLDALCSAAVSVVEDVTGEKVLLKAASTDCNIPLSLGVPAVAMGVYRGGGAHTREEWMEKDSLYDGLEIGIKALLKIAF